MPCATKKLRSDNSYSLLFPLNESGRLFSASGYLNHLNYATGISPIVTSYLFARPNISNFLSRSTRSRQFPRKTTKWTRIRYVSFKINCLLKITRSRNQDSLVSSITLEMSVVMKSGHLLDFILLVLHPLCNIKNSEVFKE